MNYETDGGYSSGSLVIQKPNPIANSQTVSTLQNTPKKIRLTGSGGTPLTFAIATAPKNGLAIIIKDSVTYTPKTGYSGTDSLYITATWGCQKSALTKIKITVTANILLATVPNRSSINSNKINATGTELKARAWPNPSATYFTYVTESNSHEPITIRVLDGLGRTVELRRMTAGGSIRLGENYKNGFYYVEAVQGRERVGVKLVKVLQ